MRRKFVVLLAVFALCAGVAGTAIAQQGQGAPAAAAPVAGAPAPVDGGTGAATPASAPTDPKDESKVPHYFGPYPNWVNSPQVLANAVVTIAAPPAGVRAEATATVDPKTGGITGYTVTNPGSGYSLTTAPAVTITSPGVTPTSLASATAVVSPGVVTSIAVTEAGFGFTTPSVAITGGGVPSAPATAQASGGVDNVTVTVGGGYATQPIVEFSLPDAGPVCSVTVTTNCFTRAEGTATMDANGTIDSFTVTTAGSGYTTAPSITIWDGAVNQVAQAPATAVATIGILQVDVTSGGAGYDSVPVVTITELVGGADKGASATATVAVLGAVTAVNVGATGAGYLTPGIKKFVDTLPGLGPTAANNLGSYIPVAVPDTTTYPGTDYYEVAVVQYRMKFHRSLPATLLRGYVQLTTPELLAQQAAAGSPITPVALNNANLDPAVAATPIAGYTGVDNPHYLGPTIVATKDRPVRITFRNLLPTGTAGNLFLPVDTTLMGSGMGPDAVQLDADGVPLPMLVPNSGTVLDGVRNPICGEITKPVGPDGKGDCFSDNRATLHLHGGITPWISDGTPHQWITPAGENSSYPQGVSVSNVPDMPDPGPGAQTFFYTNQQSARLMFYHDHAWGITRLNVYAGEAAAYLVTDAMEQALIGTGGAMAGLGVGTPLVIQDKTFLPSPAKVAQQDPTWDYARWGGEGSLWAPHVYMPAQNPGDPSGMSSFGRWMYGPWFWPPNTIAQYQPIDNPYYDATCDPNLVLPDGSTQFCEPALIPGTPNISVGMEAFNDTPLVNGTVYPTTTVDPKAYRYRILNAANDRFWNLSWYVADPRTGTLSEVALNPTELAAAQTDPVISPTPDTAWSPAGPNWIHIGSEGGFLPTPVVVPASPTVWITDPTRFDVGNVDHGSLILAPAERADVIVDFSQFRGKTLILYNDAPAAFPARVPGYDYYTGGPDLSPAGAPTTLPGYGPNTRTIMQVKVSNAAPAIAWDRPGTNDKLGALMTAWAHKADGTGVFESSMDPIIVGQAAYNTAYGTDFVASGWCNSPSNPSTKCDGYARISEQGAVPGDPDPFKFKFDTLGPAKDGNGAQLAIPLEPKGIHDEMNSATFDEFGRMTANMGLEAPGITPLTQNIILYPYVNPATELLDSTGLPSSLDVTPIAAADDGTQIWKITHNGVDTHPLHFHLYNVQVLNRVTWDNIIIPPDPSELGWKETVRVSPLEDTIVAVRPIQPTLPFGVPDSLRPYNPMMPIGAKGSQNGPNGNEAGFNNTDTLGAPIPPIENVVGDFGWEYVWHCHILSHEEMDMMRPQVLHVARALPDAPVLSGTGTGPVDLSWTDGTPVNYADPASWPTTLGTAEIGYRIERATITGGVIGAYSQVGTALANKTTFTDSTAAGGNLYAYRVVAFNAAGDSTSNLFTAGAATFTLSGVVKNGAGTPVNGTFVYVFNSGNVYMGAATMGANGAYSLAGLPPETYKLYIQTNTPAYPDQYFGGTSFATATAVPVSADTVQDLTLAAPATFTLSGVVKNGAGTPVNGTFVYVFNSGNVYMGAATMGANGAYSLAGLPPETYKLYIQTNTPAYPDQYFGGTSFATATAVPVSADTVQDLTLAAPATFTLSGVVKNGAGTPVNGTFVYVFNSGNVYMGAATMGANGAYSLAGLPPETYKLYIQTNTPAYPDQYFGGTSFATATAVPVSADTVQDLTLAAPATFTLSGVVKNGAGTPVNGTFVYVFNSGNVYMGAATMGANGAYSLAGLPPETYRLYIQTNTPAYPDQYFGGTSFATATAVPVSADTVQDLTLAP